MSALHGRRTIVVAALLAGSTLGVIANGGPTSAAGPSEASGSNPSGSTTTTTTTTTAPVSTAAPSTVQPTQSSVAATSSSTTTSNAPASPPCTDLGSDPIPFTEAMELLTDDPTGPVLFHLDCWVNRPRDNAITMLSGAARLSGLEQNVPHHAKYFDATGWDATSDEVVWTVSVSETTTFHVQLNMTSGPGDRFLLDVAGTTNRVEFGPSTATTGYDLLEPGTITIPAGQHELRLRKTASATSSKIIAMTLVRSSDYSTYQQRIDDFRVDTSWLRGKRGYMVTWGAWSYPRTGLGGTDQEAWNEFDVGRFVDEMVRSQIDYVVWSVTWTQYRFPGPISAIDQIAGPGDDRTADRDLLMEVGRALRDRGIALTVYYHVGHELGQENGDWWAQQDFPNDTYTHNGYGDRTTFFENWKKIVAEVGYRYRWLIRGFFFDDGRIYFGGDFEALGEAARTGYADRFLSYNPSFAGSVTPFQDVYFGESRCAASVDWNGIILEGPYRGLFSQCMFAIHRTWGSWQPNDSKPGWVKTPTEYYQTYRRAPDQGAISLSHMMFDGPTFLGTYADGTPADGAANAAAARAIVPNYVSDLDVGADGSLFATAPDQRVYTTSDNGWSALTDPVSDGFAAQRLGSIYLLHDGELIRRRSATRSDNLGNDGYAIATISVGADGSVFGLTTSGDLIRWTRGRWHRQNTGATGWTAVSVGAKANDVWLLDAKGDPYRFDGTAVKRYGAISVRFSAIEAATNGDLLAIGTNGWLYEYRGWRWVPRTEVGRVSEIAALSKDDFWFIDADTHWLGHVDGTGVITAHRSSIS